MPSRAKKVSRDVTNLASIPKELVSLFLTGPMTGEAINAAGLAFKKALVEASLNAELSHHRLWCNLLASLSCRCLVSRGRGDVRFAGLDELFEGRHFDREIIVLCVRCTCASKSRLPETWSR